MSTGFEQFLRLPAITSPKPGRPFESHRRPTKLPSCSARIAPVNCDVIHTCVLYVNVCGLCWSARSLAVDVCVCECVCVYWLVYGSVAAILYSNVSGAPDELTGLLFGILARGNGLLNVIGNSGCRISSARWIVIRKVPPKSLAFCQSRQSWGVSVRTDPAPVAKSLSYGVF